MLLQLKVGCRWTKPFQSLLLIIFRLILWKCKSNDAIPLLKLLQLSTYFCKYLSHPTGAALASSQDPVLVLFAPTMRLFCQDFFLLHVCTFIWSNYIYREALPDLPENIIYALTTPWIEKKTHWNNVLLKVAKGEKQVKMLGKVASWIFVTSCPTCAVIEFSSEEPSLISSTVRIPSSGLSNSLTQSPRSYDCIKMTRKNRKFIRHRG